MSAAQELRGILRLRPLQLIILASLLAFLAGVCCHLKWGVLDPDVWWHLAVGNWIVQHHSVPHTGIFSRSAADRQWLSYSWGYEVLVARAYAWLGLVGLGLFAVALTLAVAYAVYWMTRRLSGHFWLACLLALSTCYAFLFNITPRSVFFSMIFFAVVLTLILEANRSGRAQLLYYLPLILVFWANIHIQFIYGLFLIGLLAGINLLQRLSAFAGIRPRFLLPPTLPLGKLVAIFTACVLATGVGPYSFRLYAVIYQYLGAKFPYQVIHEFYAIDFRSYSHYVQLLLTAAGFYAVGSQKKVDPFKLALLTVASVVGFRSMRDSWFICISAAACVADSSEQEETGERYKGETPFETAGVAAAVAVAVLLLVRNTDFTDQGLRRAIAGYYPVNAINFLRHNPQRGPLYNTLDWGGFLIWSMPEYPVVIDGRYDLYGEDLSWHFFRVHMGLESYLTDSYLNDAGLVLLQKDAPLASELSADPRFTLIYQDQLAVIFNRR